MTGRRGELCSHLKPDGTPTLVCLTCDAGPGSPCYLPHGWRSLALELMLVVTGGASAGPRDEVLRVYENADRLAKELD